MGNKTVNDPLDSHARLTISIFSLTISIFLAVMYWLARTGFDDNSIVTVLKPFLLSGFLLLLPDNLKRLCRFYKIGVKDTWYLSDATISLYGLIALTLSGLLLVPFNVNPGFIFYLLGIIFICFTLLEYFQTNNTLSIIISIPGFILFSLWLAGVLWGSGFQNPLFYEKMATGHAEIDTLLHSSILSMIKTYGIPSTGLDGTPYLHYHYGSHWIFAQISNLLEIDPLTFYNLAYPLIFVPFFFKCILTFIVDLRKYLLPSEIVTLDFKSWAIFFAGYIGFLPNSFLKKMVVNWNSNLISESYLMSLTFAFIIFSLSLSFWNHYKINGNSLKTNGLIFLLFVLPSLIGIIGLLKISVMILLCVVLGYLFLRLKLFKKLIFVSSLILTLFTSAIVFILVNDPHGSEGIVPFSFLKNYVHKPWWMFFIFYYFWSWLFILFKVFQNGIKSLSDIKENILKKSIFDSLKTIDAEIVIILCFVGALPGLILSIGGTSAHFFSDVQYWVSLSFFLGILPGIFIQVQTVQEQEDIFTDKKKIRIRKYVLIFMTIPFILFFLSNAAQPFRSFIMENKRRRTQIAHQATTQLISAIKTHNPLAIKDAIVSAMKETKEEVKENQNYKVIKLLQEIGKMPISEKKKTLLFIPHSNKLYWGLLRRIEAVPLIAPAITGIAMFDGLPPLLNTPPWVEGLYQMKLRTAEQSACYLDRSYLYSKVLKKGFSRVIILDEANGALMKTEISSYKDVVRNEG